MQMNYIEKLGKKSNHSIIGGKKNVQHERVLSMIIG